jgi:hypothetical protein
MGIAGILSRVRERGDEPSVDGASDGPFHSKDAAPLCHHAAVTGDVHLTVFLVDKIM